MTASNPEVPGPGLALGRSAVTAIVAGALALLSLLALLFWPTHYVVWSPGSQVDALSDGNGGAGVTVKGPQTYPVNGSLLVTAVDRNPSRLGMIGLMASFLSGDADVFPDSVAQTNVPAQGQELGNNPMALWQRNAVVAALREVGLPTTQVPIVSSVVVGGPAYGKLQANDIITAVDGTTVLTAANVREAIARRSATETIQFEITRGEAPGLGIPVVAQMANDATHATVVGASFANTFTWEPEIRFSLTPEANSSTSGLLVAIGLYDLLMSEDLLAGRTVAGLGAVDPAGAVSTDLMAGVRERAGAALAAGAEVFLVPESACEIATAFAGSMVVVKVTSLGDAILALRQLALDPASPDVARC